MVSQLLVEYNLPKYDSKTTTTSVICLNVRNNLEKKKKEKEEKL
jgi:hypothetical protein